MKSGLKNLDKLAYDLVCNWFKITDFNPIHGGIDYSQIIRFYLWDKIGRALRVKNKIDYGEIEVYKKESHNYSYYYKPLIPKGRYKKNLFSRKKKVFIPFQTHSTTKLIEEFKKISYIKILTKEKTSVVKSGNVIGDSYKYGDENVSSWSVLLFENFKKAIELFDLQLLKDDLSLLEKQINGTVQITRLAIEEFKKNKPNALYVPTDNHPPFINYVLVAKKTGVPTFTYQHGLDCEHYYLNDCYTDYVGVWSNLRKEKYVNDSQFQPKEYKVIGNVFLNKKKILKGERKNKNILFLTRPHKPIKCYSPSRNYIEGSKILEAIAEFIKENDNKQINIILKAHPMDIMKPYLDVIKTMELQKRISISDENIEDLFCTADIIVTEDTTSGVEAINYYLPTIHAHLANSKPVLPFVEYGAALAGRTKKEIKFNLEKVFNLNQKEKEKMKKGQVNMVKDFMPNGEIKDIVSFIISNMK